MKLRSFLTSSPEGVDRSTSRSGRCIPRKETPVPIEEGAGWAPVMIWTFRGTDNSLPVKRLEPRTLLPLASTIFRLDYPTLSSSSRKKGRNSITNAIIINFQMRSLICVFQYLKYMLFNRLVHNLLYKIYI